MPSLLQKSHHRSWYSFGVVSTRHDRIRPATSSSVCKAMMATAFCLIGGHATCLAQQRVALSQGDSVVVERSAVLTFTDLGKSLLVEYRAMDSLSDSVALRRRSLAILAMEKFRLDSMNAKNLIVRAVAPAHDSNGVSNVFGFVLEKHQNGRWYFRGETQPISDSSDASGPRSH